MSKSKNQVPNDPLTSCWKRENYAPIYKGAVTHERFKKLNQSAKLLYIYCQIQRKSKTGKDHLYKFNRQNGTNYDPDKGYFTMPTKTLKEFNIDVGTCRKRAFPELIENGFIEVVENNRYSHKENIYKLSAKWKTLKD